VGRDSTAMVRFLRSAGSMSRIYVVKLDAAKALLAVKFLGRDPAGSQVLSTPSNLAMLLTLSSSFKHIPEASNDALRAIANALFLVPPARTTFLDVGVDGGPIVLSKLEVRLGYRFGHMSILSCSKHLCRKQLLPIRYTFCRGYCFSARSQAHLLF